MWLLQEASPVELELFACFALEKHLADAIMAVFDGHLKPWLRRSHEAASKWGPAQNLEPGRAPGTVEATRFSRRLGHAVIFHERSGAAFIGQDSEVDVDGWAGPMGRPLLIKYVDELPVEVSEPELIFAERIPPGELTLSGWPDFIRQIRSRPPLLILVEGCDGFAMGGVVAQQLTSTRSFDATSRVFTIRPIAESCGWHRYSCADQGKCIVRVFLITASDWSLMHGDWDEETDTDSDREFGRPHPFGCVEIWRI
jgi:hypothetical protein